MQLLLDFLPVIAFFVAYKLTDIYVATVVVIVAVVLQTAITWLRTRKVSTMSLVSGALVLVFGGLTLLIHDKAFIQWKPTVLNWLFAVAFAASTLKALGGKPLVQRLMQSADPKISMPDAAWRQLNWSWVGFCTLMGVANLVVFKLMSEAAWVNFKLFGMLGLTLVFVLAQGWWLSRHVSEAA